MIILVMYFYLCIFLSPSPPSDCDPLCYVKHTIKLVRPNLNYPRIMITDNMCIHIKQYNATDYLDLLDLLDLYYDIVCQILRLTTYFHIII